MFASVLAHADDDNDPPPAPQHNVTDDDWDQRQDYDSQRTPDINTIAPHELNTWVQRLMALISSGARQIGQSCGYERMSIWVQAFQHNMPKLMRDLDMLDMSQTELDKKKGKITFKVPFAARLMNPSIRDTLKAFERDFGERPSWLLDNEVSFEWDNSTAGVRIAKFKFFGKEWGMQFAATGPEAELQSAWQRESRMWGPLPLGIVRERKTNPHQPEKGLLANGLHMGSQRWLFKAGGAEIPLLAMQGGYNPTNDHFSLMPFGWKVFRPIGAMLRPVGRVAGRTVGAIFSLPLKLLDLLNPSELVPRGRAFAEKNIPLAKPVLGLTSWALRPRHAH